MNSKEGEPEKNLVKNKDNDLWGKKQNKTKQRCGGSQGPEERDEKSIWREGQEPTL